MSPLEARNSVSNCEIQFALLSEMAHMILKISPQYGLKKIMCSEGILGLSGQRYTDFGHILFGRPN